ncbi:MAG TPA: hypothetical protein VH817_01425 [Thermoleophilaceae bacterium]|jgi:hypothetical protein
MSGTLKQLRKLILGETWILPIGVGIALGICGILRAVAGDRAWWHHGGGFILLGLIALALTASLASAFRSRTR